MTIVLATLGFAIVSLGRVRYFPDVQVSPPKEIVKALAFAIELEALEAVTVRDLS